MFTKLISRVDLKHVELWTTGGSLLVSRNPAVLSGKDRCTEPISKTLHLHSDNGCISFHSPSLLSRSN